MVRRLGCVGPAMDVTRDEGMWVMAAKEFPILMNGPMVRATLAGIKTMTRRLVKPQPGPEYDIGWYADRYNKGRQWNLWGAHGTPQQDICGPELGKKGHAPHGDVGDRLWVKSEHWHKKQSDLCPEGVWCPFTETLRSRDHGGSYEDVRCGFESFSDGRDVRMRPSIHMPRWASRITLEIEAVRVERVQDISQRDAMREGCVGQSSAPGGQAIGLNRIAKTPRKQFEELWNSIHGAGAWERNGWVWVYTFKKLDGAA